jgi:gamma-glutamyl:cysteine ligase YbdK (ATP-grasp superfamily)
MKLIKNGGCMNQYDHSLFSVFGIEAEYMIVERDSLKALPISDRILQELNDGEITNEVEFDGLAWSNELVAHVLELKNYPPSKDLNGLDKKFHAAIVAMNQRLGKYNAMLLPTAMHPWFDPYTETVLWPHGQKEIYSTYDRIFSCKGHGWSNLQSVHINLPFANEQEYAQLHAAIRVVLPLIPYLCASSPFCDGNQSSSADQRLNCYELNQKRVPEIVGKVIPDPVQSFADYHKLLNTIYLAIKPLDPEGVLQHPWLNSRGAISKLDLGAIEIRVMDIQESSHMDISLAIFIVEMIKFISVQTQSIKKANDYPTQDLHEIYQKSKSFNEFDLPRVYAEIFGLNSQSINDFCKKMLIKVSGSIPENYQKSIMVVLEKGNLAKRLVAANGLSISTYQKLAKILDRNEVF